ncbi:MBL fold metallo-hydrolase [uncultured Prevotella sp.]|uniref:MBL fold metallo-hydrolase n=1 Tax=uncultured Prevotella sp. TaxID=159272 RepID=UPI0027E28BC0|nr:MBL fold metallo-hydrolase [uncultured Prevotella sp.]
MLRFISFGSGSCGNCYYLDDGTNGLLIDIGVGIRALKKQFGDYGLRFVNGFDAILVTHDHADHIKSVGSLCKKFDVPVYASRLVHEGMDKNYCMKCKIAQSHRKKIEYGEEFSIGNFNIRPFQVPHDSSDNVGYMIENGGIVFSLLTDVGRITDDMKSVIQQSDYLVIEANYDAQMLAVGPYPEYLKRRIQCGTGHLSNDQCAQALVENYSSRLKHVWLCHLSEENNKPELAWNTVVRALENVGIDTEKDVKIEVLRRKMPTGIFQLK